MDDAVIGRVAQRFSKVHAKCFFELAKGENNRMKL
jgi:hypothetical protein